MSGNQVGRRTAEKAKIICPPPSGVDIIKDSSPLKIVAPKGITAIINTALGLNLINFETLNMRLWYIDKHLEPWSD